MEINVRRAIQRIERFLSSLGSGGEYWGKFRRRDIQRFLAHDVDWRHIQDCLCAWLDDLMDDWDDNGLFWQYQRAVASLAATEEAQAPILEQFEAFEQHLLSRYRPDDTDNEESNEDRE